MLGSMRSTVVVRLSALIAFAFVLCVAPQAKSQWNASWGLINQPPVTERDTRILERMLNLSDDEVEILGVFREEASAEFGRLSGVMQEIVSGAREEFRQSRDNAVWQEVGERLEGFTEKRDEIREAFMENVELSLIDVDPVAWDRAVRRLERNYVMNGSEIRFMPMGGLTVDVQEIVEDIELEKELFETLETTLDQYAREFDREMREMVRVREEQEEVAEELTRDGDWMSSMDELNDVFVKVRDKLVVLRDINDRYMRQVISALPADQASKLEREYMEDAYPAIFRDSIAASQFRTALDDIDTLGNDQRERILALQATYEREADAIRMNLVKEAREREENLELRDMWGARRRGGGDEEPQDQRMRELATKFSEQLGAILSPEQRERLPQPEGNSDWRNRDFGF